MTRPDRRACLPIIPHSRGRPSSRACRAGPDQCRSLLDHLATITDPRQRRGRRHTLGAVLAVAVAAVMAGARSLAAIAEWAADAPGPVLAALGVRRDPLTGAWRPPAAATVRRVLARVNPDALAGHRPLAGRPAATATGHQAAATIPSATSGGRGRRQEALLRLGGRCRRREPKWSDFPEECPRRDSKLPIVDIVWGFRPPSGGRRGC
jgi:DDE_Tnp_1-associated